MINNQLRNFMKKKISSLVSIENNHFGYF